MPRIRLSCLSMISRKTFSKTETLEAKPVETPGFASLLFYQHTKVFMPNTDETFVMCCISTRLQPV